MRKTALERFGLSAIREGRPLAQLEEVLVPLYLRHRYQIDGTAKAIGGVEYAYAVRGDAQAPPVPVPAALQRAALGALLEAVTPDALRLPPGIRTQIPPRPPGFDAHRELFEGHTGLTFDPYAPAEIGAALVFGALLEPERAARLAYQADFDADLPGLLEVLDGVTDRIWKRSAPGDPYDAELSRIVQQVWADELMALAADTDAAPAVRARVNLHLRGMRDWLEGAERSGDSEELAHREYVLFQIDRYLAREYRPGERSEELTVPPGSPIGTDYLGRVEERRRRLRASPDY